MCESKAKSTIMKCYCVLRLKTKMFIRQSIEQGKEGRKQRSFLGASAFAFHDCKVELVRSWRESFNNLLFLFRHTKAHDIFPPSPP
jgi:hypothetical protein